jgi:hypothetical protein
MYLPKTFCAACLLALSAAEKDGIDVDAVLFEQPFLFADPYVALRKGQGWITQPDLLDLLRGRKGRERQEDSDTKD